MPSRWRHRVGCLLLIGTACTSSATDRGAGEPATTTATAGTATPTTTATTATTASTLTSVTSATTARPARTSVPVPAVTTSAPPSEPPTGPVRVVLSIDRRVTDTATEDFAGTVQETLTDPRGWGRAGFEFAFTEGAPYRIVLAEGPEVDRLCRPYDTGGRYSCQNGPVVALNADRWRTATPKWTGDLPAYRRMLVNHEVGHLLGQHHPSIHCPRPGQPAPVMAQQSTELDGCLPNPWPLPWEVECAARHREPLAPGYEKAPKSSCQPGQ